MARTSYIPSPCCLSLPTLITCALMPGLVKFPTFPDGVPSHPLLVIDYELLKAGDEVEIDRLWKAATELGFW